MTEKQEGPAKKSQWLKEKEVAEPSKTKDAQPTEQSQLKTARNCQMFLG